MEASIVTWQVSWLVTLLPGLPVSTKKETVTEDWWQRFAITRGAYSSGNCSGFSPVFPFNPGRSDERREPITAANIASALEHSNDRAS